MTEPLMPDIDWDIPLPTTLAEAMPELSPKEEIEMRARTVKMISDLTGKPLDPTEENRAQAHELMEQVVANKTPPDLTQYPNETLAYLGGMVAMYIGMVVRDLADLPWEKATAKAMAVADLGTMVVVQAGDDVSRLQ